MEVRNGKLEKLNDDVLKDIVGGLESWRPINSTLIKDENENSLKNEEKGKLIYYEREKS